MVNPFLPFGGYPLRDIITPEYTEREDGRPSRAD